MQRIKRQRIYAKAGFVLAIIGLLIFASTPFSWAGEGASFNVTEVENSNISNGSAVNDNSTATTSEETRYDGSTTTELRSTSNIDETNGDENNGSFASSTNNIEDRTQVAETYTELSTTTLNLSGVTATNNTTGYNSTNTSVVTDSNTNNIENNNDAATINDSIS